MKQKIVSAFYDHDLESIVVISDHGRLYRMQYGPLEHMAAYGITWIEIVTTALPDLE